MLVVDASVWVSLWVPQDRHHRASRRWLQSMLAAGRPLVEPSLLPVEIAAAIARRTRRPGLGMRAVGQLLSFSTVRFVPLDEASALLAAEFASVHRVRGADAVYASLAHRLSIPLVTWDAEQLARVRSTVAAYFPD